MKSILSVALLLFSSALFAQSSLVVFSEMGESFSATFNGEQLSEAPSSRVEKHGITQEMGKILIRFEDASKGIVTKNLFFDPNTAYVYNLKLSKKGKYVVRMVSSGPAKQQEPEVIYVSEPVETTEVQQVQMTQSTNVNTTTNVHVNEESNSENVSISVQGMGISMNVQTTSQFTETSSASIDQSSNVSTEATSKPTEVVTSTGNCGIPTSDADFDLASSSISSKSFEDSKLSIAQEVAKNKCLTSSQIKKVMELLSFEETKLDFAKFAYTYCFDPDNYYQVYDAFSFELSIDELKEHIDNL
jgi:hypothetical protein